MGKSAELKWDLSCKDWHERIIQGKPLVPTLPLFEADAKKAEAIFGKLRLPDVVGQPHLKDAAGAWFIDCVKALFGSYDEAKQERMIRELFLLVPKKNSKTSNGAALMVTAMLFSKRPRAEFLLVAPTQEVADLAFRQAVGMIEADEVLLAKCYIQDHIKKITYRPTGAFLKVKSFDPKVVTGSKPSGVLLDELHVIAESHDADRVIGQLRGGLVSQPEGFLVTITTQSERTPTGMFRSELLKARKVRDGELKAPILPVLYEFPPGVDWRNTKNWHMVTPNNGRSVSVERLIPDYEQAEAAGEEELRRWASQHLNIEIGLALRSDRWAGAEFWEQCSGKLNGLDELISRSEVIDVGIDGGGLDDLLGLAVLGRCKTTRKWLHWGKAWAHPSVIERRKNEASRFRDFQKQGDLVFVETIGDDVQEVAEIIYKVEESGLLDKIGVDPHGLGGILDALINAGVPQEKIIGVSQGWKLTGAIKTLERKLAECGVIHANQSIMAWSVSNAKVEPRGNAVLITKQAAGSAKIDPLMAMLNAVSLMSLNPESQGTLDDFLAAPLRI
jgi:phage terminase large subunit-like protein